MKPIVWLPDPNGWKPDKIAYNIRGIKKNASSNELKKYMITFEDFRREMETEAQRYRNELEPWVDEYALESTRSTDARKLRGKPKSDKKK